MSIAPGPFDVGLFPAQLTAASVTPEVAPLLEGYPLLTELAQKKGFTETVWLALNGELPKANELWAFEQALYWLSPIHVGEAPTHAGVVSCLCESWTSTSIMVAAVGLAERARVLFQEFSEWRVFLLKGQKGRVPEIALTSVEDIELKEARELLFSEFQKRFGCQELFDSKLNYRREAVAFLLLGHLGLHSSLMVEFLFVWSAFPLVLAEMKSVQPSAFTSYPARLPEIHYVEN